MSTSGSISARRVGDIDDDSAIHDLKTARTVAIRHGARALYIEPPPPSKRSTSDQRPHLTESSHLRNRDTRQSSSECPSRSTSRLRLEKSTEMEAVHHHRQSQSLRQPSSLRESSKSSHKHRSSVSSLLADDRVKPRSVSRAGQEPSRASQRPPNPKEDRYLHTTIRTPSSDHYIPEIPGTSLSTRTESRSASHGSSSCDGHLEQCIDTIRAARTDAAVSSRKVEPSRPPSLNLGSLDRDTTSPVKRNMLSRNIPTLPTSATWHRMDVVQAAESRGQMPTDLLAQSPGCVDRSGTGKTPWRFHTTQVDGSAPTSQFQYIPPCPSLIQDPTHNRSHHRGDEFQEVRRAAKAQNPATLYPASGLPVLRPSPGKIQDFQDLLASRSRTVVSETNMKLDTEKRPSSKSAKEDEGVDLPPPSVEALTSSPISPHTLSDGQTTPEDYNTPLTSPCVSPRKSLSPPHDDLAFTLSLIQLDGGRDSAGSASDDDFPLEHPPPVNDAEVIFDQAKTIIHDSTSEHHRPDLTEVDPEDQPQPALEVAPEDATPLTRASKAKDGPAFPFPNQTPRNQSLMLPAQRHPSRLLRFCEQNATPRQRTFMAGTLESPDRFIPGRTATPNKDALLLRKPAKKRVDLRRPAPAVELSDPFGPNISHSARMADRFATIRTPSTVNRPVSVSGTAVPDAVSRGRRAVSNRAVWTVGGTTVTEGIASITNGRGGRVTSRTSAPHYTADFLRRQTPSDDEIQHGQRLAVAMEIKPGARMIPNSSPLTTPSPFSPRRSSCSNIGGKQTVWNNSAWEKSSPLTPSKPPKQKPKDIPVIPFRVLDAPALRDDYYCSLLAYSPTAQCLAVGLGAHVYLWSEARGTVPTHIPDSLTAPFGAHVTSVSFSSREGGKAILAIGRANGRITLWSPQDTDPRFDSEQPAPISCVSFRPTTVNRPSVREPSMTVATEELLVGDEVGNVYYYSIEWPSPDDRDLFGWHGSMTLLARISCHTQQICGIAWSKDGELFATGGNDNQLLLFETKKLFTKNRGGNSVMSSVRVRNGSSTGSDSVVGQGRVLAITPGQQKHLFTLNAAVKAIAFAPWQPSLLAAGGGSNDRCIHFFHALSGATLATIDCHAQVTSLVWSEKKKEIAATFGFAQPNHPYRVAVFSWPSCQRVVSIPWWSEERALYAVAYPGGPSGRPAEDRRNRLDSEGRAWHGRRTRDEGCLVIATSDASIKFHEVWPERCERGRREGGPGGLLGGSMILEDGVSFEVEREVAIR